MNRKEFFKRWIYSYIHPPYFYIPFKCNDSFIYTVEDNSVGITVYGKYIKYLLSNTDIGYIAQSISTFNSFSINWGDGKKTIVVEANTENIPEETDDIKVVVLPINKNIPTDINHIYLDELSEHIITITGECSHICLNGYAVEIIQWGNVGFKSLSNFTGGHRMVNKLKKIPTTPITGCKEVTDFTNLFKYSQLEEIPSDLFKYCDNAINIKFVFYGCSNLKTIGDRVFKGLTNLVDVGAFCQECNSLYSIGDETFCDCVNIKRSCNAFDQGIGKNLYRIGNYSFKNCIRLLNAEFTFHVSSITYLGIGTFENCVRCKTFREVLSQCHNLSIIPKDTFKGCYSAENFSCAFIYSSDKAITDFTIPQDLFDDCWKANNFSYTFYYMGLRNQWEPPENFVSALIGNYIPLWLKFPKSYGLNCYYRCIGLNNFYSIPETWRSNS